MALICRIVVAVVFVSCGDSAELRQDPESLVESRSYSEWTSEPEVITGDNGGARRVFVNDQFVEGLRSGTFEVGSIGIREMYQSDQVTLHGVSLIELRNDGWFFYETFDLNDPSNVAVAEIEPAQCTFCHHRGDRFVMSELDLFED